MRILLIAFAGSLGALSRYGLSSIVAHVFGDKFALGTLTVNIVGCFLISLVMHVSLSTDIISEQLRMAVTIGFLGSLTTFSTFSYETLRFMEQKAYLLASANIVLNVMLGLIATVIGLIIGRLIVGGN